jgi:small neutral amino acid transporter SnatA (MarC family)
MMERAGSPAARSGTAILRWPRSLHRQLNHHVATAMTAFLCFLVIALIFLQSPFLQKLLGAIIWILILAYLFGAAG